MNSTPGGQIRAEAVHAVRQERRRLVPRGAAGEKQGFKKLSGSKRFTWGRCYDHNFLRFRQFSAKKLAFFSKISVMIKILHNLVLF
jgi:hypothetical protein